MLHPPPHIPSESECLALMDRYKMLPHIRNHSIMVTWVANLLAENLNKAGHNLSLETVTAGGLLHDIGKSLCINTNKDHARKGMEICLQHDFTTIAPIVGGHVIIEDYSADKRLDERTVVYYADKRVNHDKVVSLDDRLAYVLERYGGNDPILHKAIRKNYVICREIEQRIFHDLDFEPADIIRLVSQ